MDVEVRCDDCRAARVPCDDCWAYARRLARGPQWVSSWPSVWEQVLRVTARTADGELVL